eukprot:753908-Hanusia_phi.AAC.1
MLWSWVGAKEHENGGRTHHPTPRDLKYLYFKDPINNPYSDRYFSITTLCVSKWWELSNVPSHRWLCGIYKHRVERPGLYRAGTDRVKLTVTLRPVTQRLAAGMASCQLAAGPARRTQTVRCSD